MAGENDTAEKPKEQPETLTLILRKPVTLGDLVFDKLELREPVAKELAKASKSGQGVDIAITLISIIAAVPRSAVELLCQRDLTAASDFLGGFSDTPPSKSAT